MQPEVDFLNYEEYHRLVLASRDEPDVHAAILTAGDAGLRSGELRALKLARVDYVARRLSVAAAFWRTHLDARREAIDLLDARPLRHDSGTSGLRIRKVE